ncbi:MAG: transposase [Cellvibrionaceae bacterium]
MPKPRKTLISLDTTPYYHCVSRCVRRAFLCGTDESSGNCYEHRRQWVEDKLSELAGIFSLNIAAYAIMSNHYHVVLHIDQEKAKRWSQHEIVQRWHRLYRGNALSQRFLCDQTLDSTERKKLDDVIESWRERLMSISQFMQILNESIARDANHEDQCTGRFWEGRFKSQALLDEAALAACMAYVDLNPIRAKMANTPEESDHTSAKLRIEKAKTAHIANHPRQQPKTLMPFAGNPRQDMPDGLPFRLTDYLELLDWTGRNIRKDKRGAISTNTPPIVDRLGVDPKQWLFSATQFESRFKGLVGSAYNLKKAYQNLGFQRTPGLSNCKALLS